LQNICHELTVNFWQLKNAGLNIYKWSASHKPVMAYGLHLCSYLCGKFCSQPSAIQIGKTQNFAKGFALMMSFD
jgi:hypothetical protein